MTLVASVLRSRAKRWTRPLIADDEEVELLILSAATTNVHRRAALPARNRVHTVDVTIVKSLRRHSSRRG